MAALSFRPGAGDHLWRPWAGENPGSPCPGQVAFIQQGFGHFVEQIGDEETRVLILFNSPAYEEISLSALARGKSRRHDRGQLRHLRGGRRKNAVALHVGIIGS